MGFFGDPRSPIPGMGIFHFGLDQKIPGDGDRWFGIPKNLQWKIPKNRQSRGWRFGILEAENPPKKFPKIPNPGDWDLGFLRPKNLQLKSSKNPRFRKYPRDFRGLEFFSWDEDIPPKSYLWSITVSRNFRTFSPTLLLTFSISVETVFSPIPTSIMASSLNSDPEWTTVVPNFKWRWTQLLWEWPPRIMSISSTASDNSKSCF